MKSRNFVRVLAAAFAALAAIPAAAQTVGMPPPPEALKTIADALKGGRFPEAARKAAAIDPSTLGERDRNLWQFYARAAAMRAGDRDLLRRANALPGSHDFIPADQILVAADYLKTAEFARARATLDRVRDPGALPPKLRIRYLSIWARLERLDGTPAAERDRVEQLLSAAGSLARAGAPGNAAGFAWADWWAVRRYAALLAGDRPGADAVAEAARSRADAGDNGARLRLACALLAKGDAEGARAEFDRVGALEVSPRAEADALTRTDLVAFP